MKYKILSLVALLFTNATILLAGPGGPPPAGVPIDGGALLLLGAGAAYGIKRIKDSKAKTQENK